MRVRKRYDCKGFRREVYRRAGGQRSGAGWKDSAKMVTEYQTLDYHKSTVPVKINLEVSEREGVREWGRETSFEFGDWCGSGFAPIPKMGRKHEWSALRSLDCYTPLA